MPTSQRPLGALLLEMGFVSQGQLEAALAEQQRSDKRLGKLLIEAGVITEDRLVHALSQQLGIEACDPIMTPVHEAVLRMVPAKVAFEHRILPVARQRDGDDELFYVATADPLDQAASNAVLEAIPRGTQIRWMLAGETEMDLALARHYGAAPKKPKKAPQESAPEVPVRVIAGKPVAPPRRPDEGPMSPMHSTGDIFAALQEAVELNEEPMAMPPDLGPAVVSGDIEPSPSSPPVRVDSTPPEQRPVPTTGELQVVFPALPEEAAALPAWGPEPSHPSMDLARLGGDVQDDISAEIDEAREALGVDPVVPLSEGPDIPPDEIPGVVAEAKASTPPAPEAPEPEPEPEPDPVVPPPRAPSAGPSWADMIGQEDDQEEDEEAAEELRTLQAAASAMPAATDSLATMSAPSGPPPDRAPSRPPEPTAPPTELNLDEPESLTEEVEVSSGPTAPDAVAEHDATLLDLNAQPDPVPEAGDAVFAPPPEELGLDGLPLDAPPPEAALEEAAPSAPVEQPPADAPPSDEEFAAAAAAFEGDAFEVNAPSVIEVEGASSSLPDVPPDELTRAREMLQRFIVGDVTDPLQTQWVLRLLAFVALDTELRDDARLAAWLDRMGPPP